jgi:polyhydroxybutyrate depolymerase
VIVMLGLLCGTYGTACSSDDGNGGTPPAFEAGGGEDGTVVDPGDGGGGDAPDTSVKPSLVNVSNHNIDVAGDPRFYVLSVPKTYDASRSYPLIVALHGDGQNADGFRTFLDLDALSGNDAITAYPDQVIDLGTPFDQNGDQKLVAAVIAEVKGQFNVNASKVWGFGYSKGGFMLNELSCKKPGLFTAFAAHAAGAPSVTADQCPGIVGLPVMMTEGDRNVDIGASFAAQYWSQVNGCGTNLSASTPSECQKYDGCPSGKPVVYCLAPGVTHFPIWTKATTVTWDFFKAL